ncbi:MAG TPA: hypothetical protein VJA47_03910 [archaeon]|nr:hypothetical protein [archaeon]
MTNENTLHDYLKNRFGGIDIDYQTGLAAERAGLYEAAETDPSAATVAAIDIGFGLMTHLGPPQAEEFCLDRINTADSSQVYGAIREFYQNQGFQQDEHGLGSLRFSKGKTRLSVLTTFESGRPSIIVTVQDYSRY